MDSKDAAVLKALGEELGDDAELIKKAFADYKAGGLKALSADLGDIVREVEEDFTAITAALPAIKAGYKTSEFWLILAVPLINTGYFAATGKVLPLDLNIVFATLVGLYTLVRGIIKKPTPPAA